MHASIFRFDLSGCDSSQDRWRRGRSLAEALEGVQGFIAFIALETEACAAAGLCVCVDDVASQNARRVAGDWLRSRATHASESMRELVAGEVFVQRGF